MMKKLTLLLVSALFAFSGAYAQGNVGIGTNTPNTSAKLDITATDAGLLIPRVGLTGTSDATTIASAATSLLVYNTATVSDVTPGFYYWDGSVWVRLATGTGTDEDWHEQGTTTAPDAITDHIFTQGNVGIGTPTTGAGENLAVGGSFGLGAGHNRISLVNAAGDTYFGFGEDASNRAWIGWNSTEDQIKIGLQNTSDNDSETDIMTITLNGADGTPNNQIGGRVGINMFNPAAALDVMGNVAINDNELRLRGGADANHFIKYVGGSIDGVQIQGNLHTVVRSSARDLAWFIDYNAGTNDWPGVYAGAAYLGGQTGGSFGEAARLVRGRNGDGTLEFMNNGWGRIGGSNGLAFWANGNADGDDAPAMVLHSTGGIGIGTTAAPRGTIDIASWVDTGVGNFTFYANGSQGGPCCAGTIDIALYADRRIVASEFDALSDARIKSVIGLTNNQQDLNTLMGIEITDYRMKDALQDTKPYKKVIAQQVETVYPQAVSKTTNIVCDIYKMATVQNGRVAVENDLQIGEKVKLIFPNGEKILEVTAADAAGFSVDTDQTGEVFVYGREVNDFRVVDYEAISMLNVSATQEQQKLIEALQVEIAALKKENAELSDIEAKLNAITTALESRGIHVDDSAKK